MEGRRLILNDGTTIENGDAGKADGSLWLYFSGYTMQEVADIFFDADKTSKIVYQFGDMNAEYDDYTNCVSINIDADGNNSVCMKKGV